MNALAAREKRLQERPLLLGELSDEELGWLSNILTESDLRTQPAQLPRVSKFKQLRYGWAWLTGLGKFAVLCFWTVLIGLTILPGGEGLGLDLFASGMVTLTISLLVGAGLYILGFDYQTQAQIDKHQARRERIISSPQAELRYLLLKDRDRACAAYQIVGQAQLDTTSISLLKNSDEMTGADFDIDDVEAMANYTAELTQAQTDYQQSEWDRWFDEKQRALSKVLERRGLNQLQLEQKEEQAKVQADNQALVDRMIQAASQND